MNSNFQNVENAELKAMLNTMMSMLSKVMSDNKEMNRKIDEIQQDVRTLRMQFSNQFNPTAIQQRVTAMDVQRSGITQKIDIHVEMLVESWTH